MMKFATLKSIAHNIADSLGCGIGFMIGVYDEINIYEEASKTPENYIEVDFLTGQSSGGIPSLWMAKIFEDYAKVLPDFCERHGATVTDFKCLSARYSGIWPETCIVVTIEDQKCKRSIDKYVGLPARRRKVLDHLGRVRTI